MDDKKTTANKSPEKKKTSMPRKNGRKKILMTHV
jgi:hypothetical protein